MMTSPGPDRSPSRRWPLFLTAGGFIVAGVLHFVFPRPYLRIMPPALPHPHALVAVSGFFEILGGVGLLLPALRRPAGWGLIALLIAVFPANCYMAARPDLFPAIPRALLWLRLPLQPLLIGWVYRVSRRDPLPRPAVDGTVVAVHGRVQRLPL